MSLKYKLDDLGWLDFEELVQSLLILRLGLGLESWGGNGDWGRDAYCEHSLRYPRNEVCEGPFLFQSKFISGANAAGARPAPGLLKAVSAETIRIEKHQGGSQRKWAQMPAHYSLLSNAVIHGPTRQKIQEMLRSVLPNCIVHIHDGRNICNWLNVTPNIITRFPQLFTIRELGDFLKETVNSEILTRSAIAISMAKEAAQIFVPTHAYHKALNKLHKYHFVVLEGPPEMGKTTIARVIALAKLKLKWEAIECKDPYDFHKSYKSGTEQIFLADDFFGRTEYDATRISRWNEELPFILRRIDGHHWLILTSRAHLLQMGKHNLDVAGLNSTFPALGEVLVDAGELTRLEKARILYRHAKIAQLNSGDKAAIRKFAIPIIDHDHFTPLRIHNLIMSMRGTRYE